MERRRGITLVELLVSLTIMALVGAAAAAALHTCLQAHRFSDQKSELVQEGILAIERMTSGVRSCTYLLIPNSHNTTRDILAFSGAVNDDGDYYFDDPLFPRIDEDPSDDVNDDGKPGIENYDDDGDGTVDEDAINLKDDDEDGSQDEDPLDGVDNDSDGNIDEDSDTDANSDNDPGIQGMDDDGDGTVDEAGAGGKKDDDEDGSFGEDPLNPVVYSFDSGTNTLREALPSTGATVDLSTHVSGFSVTYETPDASHEPRVVISLTLTADDGTSVTFCEYVYPRNIVQKCGKKVR